MTTRSSHYYQQLTKKLAILLSELPNSQEKSLCVTHRHSHLCTYSF